MEVATGDEELKSLLQNFNRVSQVLDTTSRAASPLLPGSSYTTAARLRTAFAVHPRSVSVWFRISCSALCWPAQIIGVVRSRVDPVTSSRIGSYSDRSLNLSVCTQVARAHCSACVR
jgi:hypothetical protein